MSVVTGGAGFIGSHLVDRLLAHGHRVRVIDDLSNGRLDNLSGCAGDPRLEVTEADVADHARIAGVFKGVDHVYHLAALADIVPSIDEPLKYHRANVDGTASVLEAARQAAVARFVYTASSSCYGIPDEVPTSEAAPMAPMYPYALSKMLGEQLALHWCQTYRLPVVSLRLFNVYGPRSRTSGTYGAVFGVFLAQKLAGQPFTVVGDGSQTRDFTYVSDVVNAFVAAARSDANGDCLNVGSGGTYSIRSLVDLLGGPIDFIPKRPGEPDCTFANIDKIRARLDWQPQVSFVEGVEHMLAAIDHWNDAPVWNADSIAVATERWFECLTPRSEAR